MSSAYLHLRGKDTLQMGSRYLQQELRAEQHWMKILIQHMAEYVLFIYVVQEAKRALHKNWTSAIKMLEIEHTWTSETNCKVFRACC